MMKIAAGVYYLEAEELWIIRERVWSPGYGRGHRWMWGVYGEGACGRISHGFRMIWGAKCHYSTLKLALEMWQGLHGIFYAHSGSHMPSDQPFGVV